MIAKLRGGISHSRERGYRSHLSRLQIQCRPRHDVRIPELDREAGEIGRNRLKCLQGRCAINSANFLQNLKSNFVPLAGRHMTHLVVLGLCPQPQWNTLPTLAVSANRRWCEPHSALPSLIRTTAQKEYSRGRADCSTPCQ